MTVFGAYPQIGDYAVFLIIFLSNYFIVSSTGQWSEPSISVWIFAPRSRSLSLADVMK